MTDARNFLLNTNYSMDKIAGYRTGSFKLVLSSLGSYSGEVNLSHTHGVYPLCTLVWSFNSNFSPSYTEASFIDINGVSIFCGSTTSSIKVSAFNLYSAATIYYKLFYFVPDVANIDVTSTQSSFDNFVISTDYNYMKLHMAGSLTGTNVSVTHGLGYYPAVELWKVQNGRCYKVVYNDVTSTTIEGERLSTSTLNLFSNVSTTWYYRIYADEN